MEPKSLVSAMKLRVVDIIGPELRVVNECHSAITYFNYLYLTLLVSSDNFPGNHFLVLGIGGSLL